MVEEASAAQSRPRVSRLKLSLLALGACFLLAAPLWAPLLLRRMAFFHVRRIEILGVHYLAPSDILTRLHVDTLTSVWDPTAPLVARVSGDPAIQQVFIRRKLPGTLVVEVTERVPVALVSAKDGFRVYDERGRALPIDPSRVSVDVPVLMQRDTTVLRILGSMRERMPALYARVSTVARVGGDELLFQFAMQAVRAMTDVTLERFADLAPVEADLRQKQLRAAEIDLRFRDQVIARLQ